MDKQISYPHTPQSEIATRFSDRIRTWIEWDQISSRLERLRKKFFRKQTHHKTLEAHHLSNEMEFERRLEDAKKGIYLLPGVTGIHIIRRDL
jgi:hypothetical protein